eukprot:Rhum_TRINITY_DN18883_c0_g1::Rhum_TRINITY_DN18883_c0_g1_i1::g.168665::m.168665
MEPGDAAADPEPRDETELTEFIERPEDAGGADENPAGAIPFYGAEDDDDSEHVFILGDDNNERDRGDLFSSNPRVSAEPVECCRLMVLGGCVIVMLFSAIVVLEFKAMHHLLSLIGAGILLPVVVTRESVWNVGDPRATCNRPTAFLWCFSLTGAAAVLDLIALIYSKIENSRGSTKHTPGHYNSYVAALSILFFVQVFYLGVTFRLRTALERSVQLPA